MTSIKESAFWDKYLAMSLRELGEYVAMCFKHLENPQKYLSDLKKVPSSEEMYDVLIEYFESRLSRIENLNYCKKQFESIGDFEIQEIEMPNLNTLIAYHQISKNDKKNIEDKIQLKRQGITQLLLLVLKSLLSKNKTALIFLNSSESIPNIFNLLFQLSKSNKEVAEIIRDYRINDFQTLLLGKFQFTNSSYYNKRISEWNNINNSEINLRQDFIAFKMHCLKELRLNIKESFLSKLNPYWFGLFQDLNYGINRLTDLESGGHLQLKRRLHRIFRFEFFDKSLVKEIGMISEILSTRDFAEQVNKLLKLEESISKLLDEKNADLEFINKLIEEYENRRNKFVSKINSNLNTLIESIVPLIESEIEKAIQSEEIDSDLTISKIAIDNLKEIKNRIFTDKNQKMVVEEIFWDLLPQGEWKTEGLIKTFKGYGWNKEEFDESRLTQIIKLLNPTICYIGKEKFQGYVVFGFDSTEKVVMECPKYGNAIYIIKGDWKEITKLSKWEARQLSQVKVIRHSETWFDRLKENLESKY